MAELIVAKIEELCAELGKTTDPHKVNEINYEIENCMNELEGEC